MGAALDYDRGCDAGLIIASDDPRALRLYALVRIRARADLQGHGHGRPELLIPRSDPGIVRRSIPRSSSTLARDLARRTRRSAHARSRRWRASRGASFFAAGGPRLRGDLCRAGHLAARRHATSRLPTALFWYGLDQAAGRTRSRSAGSAGASNGRWSLPGGAAVVQHLRRDRNARSVGPLHPYIPSPPFA